MKKDSYGIYHDILHEEEQGVFPAEAQDNLFQLEDRSWWFRIRGLFIKEAAKQFLRKDVMSIDIGGGNGYTTSVLQKSGFKMGLLEPSYEACMNARRRGLDPVICGMVEGKKELWNQCLLLDVLEHIEDEKGFLKSLSDEMRPGGRLLVTVPACGFLWSSEDDLAGHYRRYTRRSLISALESEGFEVTYATYFYSFLILPIFLFRVCVEKMGFVKKKQDMSDEERRDVSEQQFIQKPGLVERVLAIAGNTERFLLRKRKVIPLGSSILCLARKNEAFKK